MILSVAGVGKAFGVDVILEGVTFRIDAREKVALVGRNGTGKTTLLKIITQQLEPDTGTVQLRRGAKIGYLRQEAAVGADRTVLQEAEAAVAEQLIARARLAELEGRLEAGGASPEDLDEYALLHEHFADADGYALDRDIRTVLKRMGFEEDEFDKPTAALSGGERTRLAIARLLLEEPDLLILDEPTNHLDLQATEWLENWIVSYPGAVLLVSHDRRFLERTVGRVLELRACTIKGYPGHFGKFLELRAEEDARLAEVARRQDQQLAKMDEYVRRFMNSQRTAQARGRLKLMKRLEADRVFAPKNDKGMAAAFTSSSRSGDMVLVAEKLSAGYPGNRLVRELDWTVSRGQRWGVVGENGAGKSTLIRTMLGELEPLGGRSRLGSSVVLGYFHQDVAELDPDQSPLDHLVWELDMEPGPARDLLGKFLFSGDDVFRPIRSLSGGEKNKLVLATLAHQRPNLLVLDEPTNHLDMASREALAEVLKEYDGTLILISHDRWLLEQVTEQTLDVRRDGVVQFPGGYADYRARASKGGAAPTKPAAKAVVEEPAAPALSPRELSKEIQRVTKLVEEIEADIADAEEGVRLIEEKLASLPPDADVFALSRQHQSEQERLEGLFASWAEQSQRLEDLRALQG